MGKRSTCYYDDDDDGGGKLHSISITRYWHGYNSTESIAEVFCSVSSIKYN